VTGNLSQSEATDRPRLLDLFCGAGGCTKGYQRAGFYVVGVDNRPQPNYCGDEFHQADALKFDLDGYDAIHASPPCQAYSVANNIHGRDDHPLLVEPVRDRLMAACVPYVIENVPRAPLLNPITICGLTLGLNVKRHRLFECSFPVMTYPCAGHGGDWLLVFGHTVLERGKRVGTTPNGGGIIRRRHVGIDRGREAMGIDWMTRDELSEAIPPAYTEHIGYYLRQEIEHAARRSNNDLQGAEL
jgi:DNA (cytosine-5)-methyltransferase 1